MSAIWFIYQLIILPVYHHNKITTENIENELGHNRKDVDFFASSCPQNFFHFSNGGHALLIEGRHEFIENFEVERWSQQFATRTLFVTCNIPK